MKYAVEIRFNGSVSGARQKWSGRVEAETVGDALELGCGKAVRQERGRPIYVSGVTVDEIRK